MARHRLLFTCPDRPGLIASVSAALKDAGANIVTLDQHAEAGPLARFFMRTEFDLPSTADVEQLDAALKAVAEAVGAVWRRTPVDRPHRLGILVSRETHCLAELLTQVGTGDIRAAVAFVWSNHADAKALAEADGIPYHHVPMDAVSKPAAEEKLLITAHRARVDTLVLARYMQILSPAFVDRFPSRIINIHHSFLPAFVGPRPYHQAHARGVKLIGATAHYVTAELDAGPIIEQDVHRVDHRHGVADYRRIGRHVERTVLARAVAWHVDERVLVDGNRTVVFPW